jgi:hypothetical protein
MLAPRQYAAPAALFVTKRKLGTLRVLRELLRDDHTAK